MFLHMSDGSFYRLGRYKDALGRLVEASPHNASPDSEHRQCALIRDRAAFIKPVYDVLVFLYLTGSSA